MKKTLITLSAVALLGIGAMSVGGAPTTTFTSIAEIQTAEENYKKTSPDGKYLQVIPNNQLPPSKTGTVKQKLGKDVPAGVQIDETMTGDKPGYIIHWEDASNKYSVGGGYNATAYTWTIPKPVITATST